MAKAVTKIIPINLLLNITFSSYIHAPIGVTHAPPVNKEHSCCPLTALAAMDGGVSNALAWSFCTAKIPKLKIGMEADFERFSLFLFFVLCSFLIPHSFNR
jgi:hypothetical protein